MPVSVLDAHATKEGSHASIAASRRNGALRIAEFAICNGTQVLYKVYGIRIGEFCNFNVIFTSLRCDAAPVNSKDYLQIVSSDSPNTTSTPVCRQHHRLQAKIKSETKICTHIKKRASIQNVTLKRTSTLKKKKVPLPKIKKHFLSQFLFRFEISNSSVSGSIYSRSRLIQFDSISIGLLRICSAMDACFGE